MESEELDSDLFTNWVRGSKGLEYLQEGLQEFVGEKVLQCRNNTLQKIILTLPSGSPHHCNQCTAKNLSPEHFNSTKACSRSTCHQKSPTNCFGSRPVGRRKCPGGICSKFYDSVIDEHVFEDPLWKNTDPSTWCSDPNGWSYAKCFQTSKDPGTSAKDTDVVGLLSIIINNKSMQNFVTSINPHNNTSSFHWARDIRNKILLSSKLEIDETTVCSYLDAFIVVLQDPKCLLNDEASKKAVHKLTQLRNNTIHISQGDTVSLLVNRNKALTELNERTAESLRKLDEKALAVRNTLKLDVDELKNAALVDVENAGTSLKQTLMAEINTARKQGMEDIAEKTTDGISKINTAGEQAIQDISGNTTDGLSKINTVGDQALQVISKAKSDIDGQKIEAISDICNAKDDVLCAITKASIETKADVLMGASAASSDFSGHAEKSFFQKGLIWLRSVFSSSSPNSHLKGSPSRSEKDSGLRQYLQGFYSKSASFYNFRSDLEGSQNLLLRIGPTFRKLDITHKEDTIMNQNEEMTESLQMPKYIHNGFRRSRPILLLTKDTTSSANFIVSSWLNFGENHTFFPMNMQTLDGVFLLKIAHVDDVSDLNKLLENTFQMKDFYYTKKILVIFEFIHTNHFKLKAVHDLACFCNLKTCSFIIIINIDKQVVVDLELNIEVILIADAINALHVYSRHTNVVIDGSELSRRIDQIVSERKRDAITKMCFENIHPINSTAKICIPVDIKYIRFHRCSHKFQVMHCANHLDISEPQFLTNPLTENIFTPQLSTLAIHFKSPSHIFYNNIYKHFACNITKANHIVLLRLCNMNFGKKVINVELQKEEIKQIKHSIESKEDYCRFGARILGPRLEKISFDKEDVEMERSNSLVKQIMLDLICYELVKTHSSVSECYPSETNDGAITLICFVNDEIQIDSFNGFRLLKRCNDYISKESLLAENACDIEDNTIIKAIEEEFKDINETLSFHAEALMTSHRNLEAAKVSFVQPKDIKLVPSNLCIALYCKAKGYIPFGDVCFPRTLNHPLKNKLFRTDVREGFFSRCHFRSGHSTDFNKKLVLGSSIGEVGGNHSATLGPFVNIKETNTTCFLTVRHVFAPLSRTNESLIGVNVVQPADVHLIPGAVVLPNRHCGMVIACQTGGQIDASLVAISPERLPTSGQFLQLTKQDLNFAGLTIQPTYNDGKFLDAKTLTVKDLATRRIIKIGCTTSLTKGLLSTTDGCVRETLEYSSLETFYNGSKESFKIQSQIMVDSLYKKVFSQSGDSGSGVFLVDDKNSLHCIGMLIGVCSDMTAVVTPINNILQILGHKMGKTLELKKFREKEEMDES